MRSPVDKLRDNINKILQEFADDEARKTKECVKKVTQAGARAVKQNAQQAVGGSGDYAKGWTSRVEEDRMGATGIIYNKTHAYLAHLLENGHVIRNGTGRTFGKTRAFPHIKEVEDEIAKDFERLIKVEL